jgi:LTXXQ motif family protein
MRKIGVFLAIATLAATLSPPTPSRAFGLRVGPFYIGIPFFGHRYRHWHNNATLRDEASLNTGAPAQDRGLTPPLLYPMLALPAVYDEIFSPPSLSPWPFSYDAIFQAAFTKAGQSQDAAACPQPIRRSVVADRIRNEIRPTGDQLRQLQKLGGALGAASDYLAKACPSEIPKDPAARLQLMEWQIEKLAQALDIVRQPLQDFEQSLNDTQRARFAAPLSTAAAAIHPDRADNIASACAATPTRVDASIEQISLSVQPTDDQRDAMTNLKQAFRNAASELDANCPLTLPPDPLGRLKSTEGRLDATWRALVSIQVALANLEKGLSDEQRVRLDATDFAAAQ